MSEYWKSTPRKYCSLCNAWFAADKASVAVHENGKKHKEMVETKLKASRASVIKKEKEERATAQLLAKIEEDAAIAMGIRQDVSSTAARIGPDFRVTASKHGPKIASEEVQGGPGRGTGRGALPTRGRGFTGGFRGGRGGRGAGRGRGGGEAGGAAAAATTESSAVAADAQQYQQQDASQQYQDPEGWVMTWTAEGMPYYYNVFTQVSSWEQPPSYAAGYAAAMSAAPYSAEGAGGTADAASAPEAAEGTEGQEAQGNAEAGSDDDSSDSDSKGDNDEDAIPLPEDEQEDTKPAAAGAAGAAAPPVPPQPATAPKKEKEEKAENKDDGGDKSPKGNERKQVYAPSSMIGLPTGNPLGWTVVAPKTEVVKPAAKPELATLSLKPKSSGGASAGTKKRGISAAGDGDDADEPLPTLKQVKEQKDAPPEQLLTFEEKQTPALKKPPGAIDEPVAFKKKRPAGQVRRAGQL